MTRTTSTSKKWEKPGWLASKHDANTADVDIAVDEDGNAYTVVFKSRNWRLTTHPDESDTPLDGPSMWHRGCKGFTHVLSRSRPQCSKCGVKIPDKIQTLYTLLNWKYGHKEEYFCE